MINYQSSGKRTAANLAAGKLKIDVLDPSLANGCVTPTLPGINWIPIKPATNSAFCAALIQKMIADKTWQYGFKDLTWDNYPEMLKFDFGKAFYHHIDEKMFQDAKNEYQAFPYNPEENYNCLVEHAEQDWRDMIIDSPVPMLVIAGEKSPFFNPDFTKAIKFLNEKVECLIWKIPL